LSIRLKKRSEDRNVMLDFNRKEFNLHGSVPKVRINNLRKYNMEYGLITTSIILSTRLYSFGPYTLLYIGIVKYLTPQKERNGKNCIELAEN
jgi:hypothetical protein